MKLRMVFLICLKLGGLTGLLFSCKTTSQKTSTSDKATAQTASEESQLNSVFEIEHIGAAQDYPEYTQAVTIPREALGVSASELQEMSAQVTVFVNPAEPNSTNAVLRVGQVSILLMLSDNQLGLAGTGWLSDWWFGTRREQVDTSITHDQATSLQKLENAKTSARAQSDTESEQAKLEGQAAPSASYTEAKNLREQMVAEDHRNSLRLYYSRQKSSQEAEDSVGQAAFVKLLGQKANFLREVKYSPSSQMSFLKTYVEELDALKKTLSKEPTAYESLIKEIESEEAYIAIRMEKLETIRALLHDEQLKDVQVAYSYVPMWDTIKITNPLDAASRRGTTSENTMVSIIGGRIKNNIKNDPAFRELLEADVVAADARRVGRAALGNPEPAAKKGVAVSRGIAEAAERSKPFNATLGAAVLDKKIARCFAASAGVATTLILDSRFTGSIELAGSRNVDHAFIIINRQNTDDPNGLEHTENWGEESFVVDIWQANQRVSPKGTESGASAVNLESHIITDPNSWVYAEKVSRKLADGSTVETNGIIHMQTWAAQDRTADRNNTINWINNAKAAAENQ